MGFLLLILPAKFDRSSFCPRFSVHTDHGDRREPGAGACSGTVRLVSGGEAVTRLSTILFPVMPGMPGGLAFGEMP